MNDHYETLNVIKSKDNVAILRYENFITIRESKCKIYIYIKSKFFTFRVSHNKRAAIT